MHRLCLAKAHGNARDSFGGQVPVLSVVVLIYCWMPEPMSTSTLFTAKLVACLETFQVPPHVPHGSGGCADLLCRGDSC